MKVANFLENKLGIAFIAFFLALLAKSGESAASDGFFGVNAQLFPQNNSFEMPLLKNAGVQWVRADFAWYSLEPERGVFNWERWDQSAAEAQRLGIKILGILAYTPDWASQGGGRNSPPEDLNDWEAFVAAAVERYRGKVDAWQIWNEPNLPGSFSGSVAEYTELVKVAWQAAKRVNPDCRIVACGPAGVKVGANQPGDTKGSVFLQGFYANGGKDFCDVIAIHSYQYNAVPDFSEWWLTEDLRETRRIMAESGDAQKPVWITEIGWSTYQDGTYSVTEEEQARILLKVFTTACDLGIGKVFWYNFLSGLDPKDREQNFGLVDGRKNPKPAWWAYKTLTGFINGASGFALKNLGDGIKAFLLSSNPDKQVWVMWSQENKQATIPAQGWDRIYQLQQTGTDLTQLAPTESLTVQLQRDPIYLIFQSDSFGFPSFTIAPNPLFKSKAGEVRFSYLLLAPAKVSLRLYNLSGQLIARLMAEQWRPEGEHVESWTGAIERRAGPYLAVMEVKIGAKTMAKKRLFVIQ
jgi:hypothetical protein